MFKLEVWNMLENTTMDLPRTNNSVEGWHTQFAKVVAVNHPTLFKLVQAFKKEQSNSETNLQLINAGHDLMETKKMYKERTERIKRLIENFNRSTNYGQQDRLTFLFGIAGNLSL